MTDDLIQTKGLTKRYGEQTSVNDLDLHVKPGRIYGLLGRNGAGKTTTMRMLLGLTMTIEEMREMGNPIHHLTLDAQRYLIEQGVKQV